MPYHILSQIRILRMLGGHFGGHIGNMQNAVISTFIILSTSKSVCVFYEQCHKKIVSHIRVLRMRGGHLVAILEI